MKLLKTVALLLFFCQLVAHAQNSNADSLLSEYKRNNKLADYANLAHTVSVDYGKAGDFINALKYGLEEVKFKKHLPVEQQKNSLFNLGLFFFKNEAYSESIKAYNKVIDSFSIDEYTYRAYCENARNYEILGDFYLARNYFEKGLVHPEIIKTSRLMRLYLNHISLNTKISTTQSLAENNHLIKKVDSLSRVTSFSENNIYHQYSEYGLFYKNELNYNFKKSQEYFTKFLKKATSNENSEMILKAFNNLAVLYNIEKKDSALYYINSGLQYAKDDIDRGKLYLNKAEYFFYKNNTQQSLHILQRVLQLTLPTKIDSSIHFLPSFKTLKTSKHQLLTLVALQDKAKYILDDNELSKNKELLQLAYQSISLADQMIDRIRITSLENDSKLLWQTSVSNICMLGVKACFKLNKPNEAFYFIEKNRALLLLENIKSNKSKANSSLPPAILQQELEYKKRIYTLENQRHLIESSALKNEYHSLKIEYNNFRKSLEVSYPEYYNSRLDISLESIATIKENLDDHTTILEYIVNEKQGFLLIITRDRTKLLDLGATENLETKINAYLKRIRQPLKTPRELANYNKTAQELYHTLLPIKDPTILKNKLVIIPDYTLQNLPFESLKNNNKYLIEDFEISYAYSLTFLNSNKSIKRDAPHSFIGFAPESFNYDNLQTLPRSNTETTTIGNALDGTVLLDDFANKEHFFSEAKDYKIIHLSTHANANDSIAPWIAFKNEKLYLNELYTTKNQAELVVLNACNSSLGKINNGEGVFSLARGFFYSGANSVVSSLWNVNDKSNSEITTNFYRYLKEGKTKSAALRQAKLDYIHTHSLSDVSPYYWSSLILIGDTTAMYTSYNLLLYIPLALLFGVILFFIIKKIKTVGNNS